MDYSTVISYVVSALLALGFPIILGIIFHKKMGVSWRFWWYGVLVMLVFQGFTRIPLLTLLQSQESIAKLAAQSELFFLGFVFFLAFTAGLFEEGGRFIAYRYFIKPEDRTPKNGLMMGIGHGGLEAIVIGLFLIAQLVLYIVVKTSPPETLATLGLQNLLLDSPGWMGLLSGWERICTVIMHGALSLMVLLSFLKGFRFWWYALAAHTAIDFVPLLVLRYAPKIMPENMALILAEVVITLFAIVSYLFIKKLFLTQKSES